MPDQTSTSERENGSDETSRLILCAECDSPYTARFTDAGEAIPIGVTQCGECGSDEFELVDPDEYGTTK